MQTFIDSATQQVWAFDDDVEVENGFATSPNIKVAVPVTLKPCTPEQAAAAAAPKPFTGAMLLKDNTIQRDSLLNVAALAIGPLQDAVDLGQSTAVEDALLKSWKEYRIAVNRIDLTQPSPTWPVQPA
ncbi:MAG TPA: tail fiber assembly protein [Paraburkholderia sp.]